MTERLIGETGSRKRRRFLFVPIVLVACMRCSSLRARRRCTTKRSSSTATRSRARRRTSAVTRRTSTGTACSTRTATQSDRCRPATGTPTSSGTSRTAATTFITNDHKTSTHHREQGHASDLGLAVQLRQQREQQDSRDELCTRPRIQLPTGDEIVYFGIERNVNTGDRERRLLVPAGLKVGCSSTGGAVTFTGAHQDGDLLVVSEFSGGGTVSTINAYRWDRPDSAAPPGSLNPTPIANGVDCRGVTVARKTRPAVRRTRERSRRSG